ncbi:hypothetical protein EAH_00020110 [Eimeria acervulina]|uniref:Uncharacterized protein n=1 Tax=Eimeria acervulina TaxID=5801 RepID=U6GBE5_EIMAC|nr:hypothetical protein EAH_00020110 [Eimeria acervulina]CDI76862.1 hypothetical protein EAH_00020110 [Eimeria acervulina]
MYTRAKADAALQTVKSQASPQASLPLTPAVGLEKTDKHLLHFILSGPQLLRSNSNLAAADAEAATAAAPAAAPAPAVPSAPPAAAEVVAAAAAAAVAASLSCSSTSLLQKTETGRLPLLQQQLQQPKQQEVPQQTQQQVQQQVQQQLQQQQQQQQDSEPGCAIAFSAAAVVDLLLPPSAPKPQPLGLWYVKSPSLFRIAGDNSPSAAAAATAAAAAKDLGAAVAAAALSPSPHAAVSAAVEVNRFELSF